MADVLVLERDETGRTVRRIEAATATWDENGLWQLNEGSAIDLAELPRPPQPVASLTTDLDPMVLLASSPVTICLAVRLDRHLANVEAFGIWWCLR